MQHTITRSHAFVMLVLTTLYLLLELSFNARLLDIVGGLSTPDEIEGIQKWGRAISGIALTLAIWGAVLLPASYRHPLIKKRLVVLLIATAAGCLATAWILEKRLIDRLVDNSTGPDRRTAVHLRVAVIAALRGTLPIGDLDLGDPNVRPPAAKAFLAIFPALALSNPIIGQRLEPLIGDPRILAAVSGSSVLDPGPVSAWRRTFLPLFSNLKESYDASSQSYKQTISNISILQSEKWADYLAQLRTYGLTPTTARLRAAEIIFQLRKKDLNIPSNWDPSDQATFFDAIADRTRRMAASVFAAQPPRCSEPPFLLNLNGRNSVLIRPSRT